MKNIEFKARCRDLDALRLVLKEHRISLERRMHQIDTYFHVRTGRLKLREIDGEEAELIQYQRSDRAEVRESDYQVVTATHPGELKTALERALGIWVVVDKIRELYLWDHTRVHLDQVRNLGTFMELETVVSGLTLDQARTECQRIRESLSISESDLVTGSYSDMSPETSEAV